MVAFGRAGIRPQPVKAGFAPPTGPAAGGDLPAHTGIWAPAKPGPGPHSTGGQLGGRSGFWGSDPRALQTDPPRHWIPAPEGGTGADRRNTDLGIVGFNDQLRVVDRHAYWDTGTQRTGNEPSVPGNPPNPVTDGPARPDLRLTQRSLTHQVGSDNTSQQDDLTRPYTWLGEQGSGWAPVYGGVHGLYQPYGTRGGVPFPIVSPVAQGDPADGPAKVFSGPPHGLHSLTIGGRWQTNQRYSATPQMRPGRVDRPANSPQAGQSYSQTVQRQADTGQPAGQAGRGGPTLGLRITARGWSGQ